MKLIKLRSISNTDPQKGYLLPIENDKDVPFEIRRVYCIFCGDEKTIRGKHAHKKLKQLLVCLSGNCDVTIDNGVNRKTINLSDTKKGLVIENMEWREITNFSKDCIIMVLASELYDEDDYIRNYKEFLKHTKYHSKKATKDIEEYSNNYKSQLLQFEAHMVKYRKTMELSRIAYYKPNFLLEVGCGLDPIYNYYNAFKKLVIVEPAKNHYNNVISTRPKNVTVINDFFENVTKSFEHNFDMILVSGLLHEVVNVGVMLEKIYDFSTKDTIVHISVPNAHSFHRLLAQELGLINNVFELSDANKKLQQSNVFSKDKLKSILIDKNFQIINEGSYFIKPFTHTQMQKMLDSKIINQDILDGLYKMSKYMPKLGSEFYLEVKKAV